MILLWSVSGLDVYHVSIVVWHICFILVLNVFMLLAVICGMFIVIEHGLPLPHALQVSFLIVCAVPPIEKGSFSL
ncbi:hypothetical protein DSM101010T_36360 [Desulfovibrio subterraneus]|uniref:Uncharacterized protein n=1 Tax=Desulfovibrio subterraneus TaxID=2718620 RepID=A0A7J0BPR7_9BACT|nr:hypothetical protein DSM101010T_36360 [Desulfovibrio subterraneus]